GEIPYQRQRLAELGQGHQGFDERYASKIVGWFKPQRLAIFVRRGAEPFFARVNRCEVEVCERRAGLCLDEVSQRLDGTIGVSVVGICRSQRNLKVRISRIEFDGLLEIP